MLQHLSIQNIVLIKKCELHFDNGLCVLTGETGAGKSILLDALGLLLGMRADSRLLRSGADNANVAGSFDVKSNASVAAIMAELDLEYDDEIIIRRTLTKEGKSRCFINDAPVSVNTLKHIGEALVEIHGQHEQRGLMQPSAHRNLLDTFGGLEKHVTTVGKAYKTWQAADEALRNLYAACEKAEHERDYLQHMADELSALAPKTGEEETLSDMRTRMMQSEKLADTLKQAHETIMGNNSVDAALASSQRILMRSNLQEASRFAPAIDMLERAQNEVAEAIQAIELLQAECVYDPAALDKAEERLFALKAAARKYKCDTDALPALLEETQNKLSLLTSQQSQIEALKQQCDAAKSEYVSSAEVVSQLRAKAATALEKKLHKELVPLKMQATKMRVSLEKLSDEQWSEYGVDNVCFDVATNAGSPLAPLHKIASGGELSRFMLAFKVVLSSKKSAATMIFDEIDTGTGGAVADAIGARLAMLSQNAQILVVTHLPQVAARGSKHYTISKTTKNKETYTQVRLLDEAARKEELARMLAASEVTDEARAAAVKLMEVAS